MPDTAAPVRDNPGFLAYRIVGLYALFGGLWILLSDRLLWALVTDPYWNKALQTYKGWFYVAVTAVFLYLLIRQALTRLENLEEARRSAELKFLQAQKMELVGRLAGGVAHDFNNVLTAIMGLAQMTVDGLPKKDPRRADLQDILRFSERASAITNQLLAFSRKQFSQPRRLDLGAQLKGAEKMLRRAAGEAVALEVRRAENLWAVQADPCQVDQVLLNLAVNARDAMPRGGELIFSVSNAELRQEVPPGSAGPAPAPYVLLTARDSGCGMDQETRGRIFEPFFTTKEAGKGTGLGLSVVHGIVEQAGGRISVESRPGAGTTFSVYLPKYEGGETDLEQPPAREPSAGGEETVLLVDDQPEVLAVMSRSLESRGYKVLRAGSYDEALARAAAAKGRIEILVADTVLTGRSGLDLADRLIELFPGIKVLFVSGHAADPDLREKILARERPFLPKPFTPEVLLAKVRRTLDAGRP